MTKELIEKLATVLAEVVRADGAWATKKVQILENFDEADRTNLEEFVGWFDE